jgi:hypothetical protein
MQAIAATPPVSKTAFRTGLVLSALAVLFLLFDGVIHILKIAPVVETFTQLGYPVEVAVPLGIVELVCLAAYVWPRSAVLGAVLLTGYLGGAVAIHVRVGSSLFGQTLFPVYVGLMVWGGLYLRDERLRALFPLRS